MRNEDDSLFTGIVDIYSIWNILKRITFIDENIFTLNIK